MIAEYIADLASQSGIKLSRVRFVEGRTVGCLDVHLLHLVVGEKLVSALVYQSELDALHSGTRCKHLDAKIRNALSRLQVMIEPEPESNTIQ
jgi:hypothetical protein